MGYLEDKLTEKIIGCIIKVHRTLGPGFMESVYQRALVIEFRKAGLQVQMEREYAVKYEGEIVGRHRLDILVEGKVVVELKTVKLLSTFHFAQARAYLKATGLRAAVLVNFSCAMADFRRIELQA